MKAISQLKNEHQGVKTVFRVLEKICANIKSDNSLDSAHLESILEFLKVFVDKCHHGKEEDLLFPAMEQAGIPGQGPISVMLSEHTLGRNHIKAISNAFAEYKAGDTSALLKIADSSEEYISLMTAHIDKEDHVLYPMGEQHFSNETDEVLYRGFEKLETERIGAGRHEKFHDMINHLADVYGILK